MDAVEMEKKLLPFLRRLPKRSVVLLYVLCVSVTAFVVASLYFEKEETTATQPTAHKRLTSGNLTPGGKHVPSGVSWKAPEERSKDNLEVSKDKGNVAAAKVKTSNSVDFLDKADVVAKVKTSGNVDFKVTADDDAHAKPKAEVKTETGVSETPNFNSIHPTTKTTKRRKKPLINNTRYIYLTPNTTTSSTSTTTSPPTDTCNSPLESDAKLILLWTSFFGNWRYMPQERLAHCGVGGCGNCRVTHDRRRLLDADAVVFHARDMSLADLPAVRRADQRWVFYCLESPPYSDFSGLQHMRGMFNWTMTYRLDSDVVSQYGSVKRIRPPRPMDMQSLHRSFMGKRRSVAWLSSHCPTHGGRDAYVDELRRHIDVDVYGSCGVGQCPSTSPDHCHSEFAKNYKFLLAFENAICKDYVTEKFYRTLAFDIVPVVFGGGPYEKFAPPGSFVDALKFKSPRHLAFFLKGVGDDFDRYATYFKWRADFQVSLSNDKECDICRLLHGRRTGTSYPDLRKWWVDGSQCRTWEPKT